MGQNWAITIGINRYKNLQPLQFAQRDAEVLRDYVRDELGCHQSYHFSDDSPPIAQDYGPDLDSQPTFATLRRFLRVRFDTPFLKPGDNLWFFFAGHGVRYDDRDYLMPIDADPGDVASTAIALHYVTERLQRSGADNVILLIDACRSHSGRRQGLGIGQERQLGVITLFACSPQESSYEIEALQHGAFTYALLEGLRLQGEGGNCATVERLYHYLVQSVPRLNQHHGKPRQTPYGRIEPLTKNHLILLPRKATVSDVVNLKSEAMRAELRRDFTLAKQLWIRVLAVSPADPEAIEGIERLVHASQNSPSGGVSTPAPSTSQVSSRQGQVSEPPTPLPKAIPQFEFEIVTITGVEKSGFLGKGTPKVITQTRKGKAEYRREDLGNGITLDLVLISGGSFMMGSPESEASRDSDESPQHRVTVPTFMMGKYAVTQVQWKAVAALPKVGCDLAADPSKFKGNNRPVECVSWDDAVEFCNRLSRHTGRDYRLPSEAEWEYACRAGTTTPFHFGETITPDLVNYDGNYTYGSAPKGQHREQTTEVGSFKVANAFGLYDMHGNVYEWCQDHWHDTYQGAPTDGSAWLSSDESKSRLLRGGSWNDLPGNCRSANRSRNSRDGRYNFIGVRVVCSVSSWTLA